MTIEIDDAGWGDLVGGCVIVVRRVETGEYVVGEIPVELFQGHRFRRKEYLDKAVEIVKEALRRLRAYKKEEVRVCTGYVLSKARRILVQEGYAVRPARITGETQRMAEQMFLKTLRRLGLNIGEEEPRRRFQGLLEWVRESPENRERYVKTGWKSWGNKWRAKIGLGQQRADTA